MGWKWNNIRANLKPLNLDSTTTDAIDQIVTAKKHELATKLDVLALAEEELAASPSRRPKAKEFHEGRAAAFREVRDAVKPKAA